MTDTETLEARLLRLEQAEAVKSGQVLDKPSPTQWRRMLAEQQTERRLVHRRGAEAAARLEALQAAADRPLLERREREIKALTVQIAAVEVKSERRIAKLAQERAALMRAPLREGDSDA